MPHRLPDNPVMTLPAVAAPDASDGATPAAAAAKPKNSWARIAALGEAADATRGSLTAPPPSRGARDLARSRHGRRGGGRGGAAAPGAGQHRQQQQQHGEREGGGAAKMEW